MEDGDRELFDKRYEQIRSRLGTQFMPDGIEPQQMTEEGYPPILCEAFKRVVGAGIRESPDLLFQPVGSYVYKDSLQMITIMGIVLRRADVEQFLVSTDLRNFDLAGLDWDVKRIEVPDLSLREKLRLDRTLFADTALEVQNVFGIPLAEDSDESMKMIESYMKFYRYYPNFHPVVI